MEKKFNTRKTGQKDLVIEDKEKEKEKGLIYSVNWSNVIYMKLLSLERITLL